MGNFFEFFLEEFFGRNFLIGFFWEDFLGGFFCEDFFWRIFLGDFWEGFFGRNYLVIIIKELMFLSRFWGNFVSMEKEGRRKEEFLILRSATQAHRT